MPFPPEFEWLDDDTTSTTYVSVLEITGGGFLQRCSVKGDVQDGSIKFTIDGHVIELTTAVTTGYAVFFNMNTTNNNILQLASFDAAYPAHFWFQDAFKVEIKTVAGGTFHILIHYGVL